MSEELPETHQRRLLFLSCSKAKRQLSGKVAALNLYDGPAFRVLRKYYSISGDLDALDVIILSARYGFISPLKLITTYDQRLGSKGGPSPAKLRSQLAEVTIGRCYSEVFINLGVDYLSRLPDLETVLDGSPTIIRAHGRIGERLHELKKWLSHDEAVAD